MPSETEKGFKMRFRSCLMLLFVMSFVAGCATTPDWCASNRALRPTAEDVETISSGMARQILEHNRMGAKACGWKR
ncbi:hypothetical protein E0H68_06305 [Rhizobium leguminosarum bv. viciae]|nr:hypothetical protein E0H68_06305 [Rhizobium leguminosarum bv. viciae]